MRSHPADRNAVSRPAGRQAGQTERPGADTSVTLEAAYRRERGSLIRLAAVLTQDRNEAEDVVQDAFVGLQRRQQPLADPASIGGYLRVSVVNGARSRHRRRVLFRRHAQPDYGLAPPADTATLLREEYKVERLLGEVYATTHVGDRADVLAGSGAVMDRAPDGVVSSGRSGGRWLVPGLTAAAVASIAVGLFVVSSRPGGTQPASGTWCSGPSPRRCPPRAQ